MHTHRAIPINQRMSGWTYCVTPNLCAAHPQRQAAHGNVVYTDTCRCGATRMAESNWRVTNYGTWTEEDTEHGSAKFAAVTAKTEVVA